MKPIEDRALGVIEQLKALDVDDEQVTQGQGEWIAALLNAEGGYSLFVELDERPGRFDPAYPSSDWHWKLRQARNGCDAFFDILNEDDQAVAEVRRKLAELKVDCGYHELDAGSVDALIAYKEALEDQFSILWPRARAWDRMDEALRRNARGESHSSAADVCAVGFSLQERVANR